MEETLHPHICLSHLIPILRPIIIFLTLILNNLITTLPFTGLLQPFWFYFFHVNRLVTPDVQLYLIFLMSLKLEKVPSKPGNLHRDCQFGFVKVGKFWMVLHNFTHNCLLIIYCDFVFSPWLHLVVYSVLSLASILIWFKGMYKL